MGIKFEDVRTESTPSEVDGSFCWTIKRASPDTPTRMIVVSHHHEGYRTHFYRNRTGPCLKTECEACAKGQLSRWNGYVLAVDCLFGRNVVFEFTPSIVQAFVDRSKEYGSLRGLQMIASRTNKRPNSKVAIQFKGLSQDAHKLPPDQPIWPILSHIWGLTEHAPAQFSEFSIDSISEAERVAAALPIKMNGHDDEWVHARLGDLAGQLVLPIDASDQASKNGKPRASR